jgi:hypothetical protein
MTDKELEDLNRLVIKFIECIKVESATARKSIVSLHNAAVTIRRAVGHELGHRYAADSKQQWKEALKI